MRFAIRDDDMNFFTDPEILEMCYQDIWDVIPPSLCIISKVKGNWPEWVREIYEHKENTNWERWKQDDRVYPIEQNSSLIKFVKTALQRGKIDVCFHAKHHRNEDEDLPCQISGNYVQGAEFYTNHDYSDYIRQEVAHLRSLLDHPITVFTPPQNLLSAKGYQSVLKAGLNICGSGIPFYKKSTDIVGIRNILKQLFFKIRNNEDYPYVVHFKDHSEINYHYPLQPNTQLKDLINKFESVRRHDGDFVLSTHHAEFSYAMEYDRTRTMRNVLEEFLGYISRYSISYTTLSDLLKPKGWSYVNNQHH